MGDTGLEDLNSSSQLQLLTALKRQELQTFQSLLLEKSHEVINCASLLVSCCKASYGGEYVKSLLKYGADPNSTNEFLEIPLHTATSKGNYQILEILLSDERTLVHIKDSYERSALHIATKYCNPLASESEQYYKCMSLLLDWSCIHNDGSYEEEHPLIQPLHMIDINAIDWLGNTALHYSVNNGDQRAILLLLRHNASLAISNDKGTLAINGIAAETLETFLDECITDVENHSYIIHYKFLSSEQPTCLTEAMLPNSDNILFYYPYGNSKKVYSYLPEMNCVKKIAESPDLKHLIKHPVLTSFVYLKWKKCHLFYFLNLLYYIIIAGILISWVFISSELLKNTSNGQSVELLLAKRILCGFLLFFIGSLLISQLFVLRASDSLLTFIVGFPKNLEANLTINVIIIVMAEITGINVDVKFATAITVMFSCLVILVKTGQHPLLSPCFYVIKNYFKISVKYIAWLSVLAVGIAISMFFLICNSHVTTFQSFFNETRNICFFLLSCIIVLISLNALIGVAVNEVIGIDKEFIQIYSLIILVAEIETIFLGNPVSFYLQVRKLRINPNRILCRYARLTMCLWNTFNLCRWFPSIRKRIILFPETTTMKRVFSVVKDKNFMKTNKTFLRNVKHILWEKEKNKTNNDEVANSLKDVVKSFHQFNQRVNKIEESIQQISTMQQQLLTLLSNQYFNLDESHA